MCRSRCGTNQFNDSISLSFTKEMIYNSAGISIKCLSSPSHLINIEGIARGKKYITKTKIRDSEDLPILGFTIRYLRGVGQKLGLSRVEGMTISAWGYLCMYVLGDNYIMVAWPTHVRNDRLRSFTVAHRQPHPTTSRNIKDSGNFLALFWCCCPLKSTQP